MANTDDAQSQRDTVSTTAITPCGHDTPSSWRQEAVFGMHREKPQLAATAGRNSPPQPSVLQKKGRRGGPAKNKRTHANSECSPRMPLMPPPCPPASPRAHPGCGVGRPAARMRQCAHRYRHAAPLASPLRALVPPCRWARARRPSAPLAMALGTPAPPPPWAAPLPMRGRAHADAAAQRPMGRPSAQ